jgi:uncharacterized protein (DUF2384 family)
MTYRKCRNPHRPVSENEQEDIIVLAMECFGWTRKKVQSWYEKENPRLKKARPRELVDRGQGDQVVEFLETKRQERTANQKRDEE